jgi:hypothetical protein
MKKGEYRHRNKLGVFYEKGVTMPVLLSWIVKLFLMQYRKSKHYSNPIEKFLAPYIQFYLYTKGVSTHMWNYVYFTLSKGRGGTEMKKKTLRKYK